jgi:hypothetical protein
MMEQLVIPVLSPFAILAIEFSAYPYVIAFE